MDSPIPSESTYPDQGFIDPGPSSLSGSYDMFDPSTQSRRPSINTSQAPPGKVAIPALRSPQTADSMSKGYKKGRTPHACDNCRKAKAGCTGEQPCLRCRNSRVSCVYGDGKRDKEKKVEKRSRNITAQLTATREMSKLSQETSFLTQQNTEVTEALRRIRLDNSLTREGIRGAIDDVLAMVSVVE